MDTYISPLDLVRHQAPERPVACARPARLTRSAQWFQDRFPGEVLYAVKANPSPWAVDVLHAAGVTWFDVASEAEAVMVRARCPDATLAFMHPVKGRRAIARAYHDLGCRIFVLDCEAELAKIVEETGRARDLTLVVRLAVNNDGAALPLAGKFGATAEEAPGLLRAARAHAEELGVSFHVGSQCMRPSTYAIAMLEASKLIARAGVTVDIVDVGGGFPALYPGMTPPPLEEYVAAISAAFEEMMVLGNAELWCEPGRALVAEGASVLARVELRKGDSLYLNDGAFGNLFDACHMKWPYPVRLIRADGSAAAAESMTDSFKLFGPTCDSMDVLPGPFFLPGDVAEGDYIEIGMLGAYGAALATGFNGFGVSDTVVVEDHPWPSLYDEAPSREPRVAGAEIVRMPRRALKAKGRRR